VDVNLAAEGREQAKLLGKRLSEYGIDCLYSSDLLRARETAEIAKIYLGDVDYRIRTELREIDFGRMTGNSDEYNLVTLKRNGWNYRRIYRSLVVNVDRMWSNELEMC